MIRIIKILLTIIVNIVILYFFHLMIFRYNYPFSFFYFVIAILSINFSFLLVFNLKKSLKEKVLFVFLECIITLIFLYLMVSYLEEKFWLLFWTSIIIISVIRGFMTGLTFSMIFKIKLNYKKYLIILILSSLSFPIIDYLYFAFIYHRIYYDLSFYIMLPKVLIAVIWQLIIVNLLKDQPLTGA